MSDTPKKPDEAEPYAGRWIAQLGERVVGQGGTPEQARQAAKAARHKEKAQVSFVAPSTQFAFSPILERVREVLPGGQRIYLAGGAVRDALLQKQSHDLDFAVPRGALRLARKVANALKGAYYRMDAEHETGRVVLIEEGGGRYILDFATMRGKDLEGDLLGRDFTINAMAVDVHKPGELLDPLGGAADLAAGRLKACTPSSFLDDPVRVLRAVRFAAGYKLAILPETRQQMKAAVGRLSHVSMERRRDELFRILNTVGPATSVRALDILGVMPHLLPELDQLKGVAQPEPHVWDVWEHTLQTVQFLEQILAALDETYDEERANQLHMGLIVLRLGRYRKQISAHLNRMITPERPLRPLLFLAASYHDIAKPECRVEEEGRIRFIGHDHRGGEIAAERAKALRLSNAEVDRLKSIIANHMRLLNLTNQGVMPSRRTIYRFFRDTGEAGVDVCLLSLANLLATYGTNLPQDTLAFHLDVLRALLEAWWEQPESAVSPPALLNGNDLIHHFDLQPGPQIGQMLEAVREAQAAGEIETIADAKAFVGELLREEGD